MNTIQFDAALSDDAAGQPADGVVRTGLLFRVGEYPDKSFSLTTAEADAAVAAFRPVPADYEHTPGPLDGQLGALTRVWREGDALYGEATVPAWLDPLLAATGRKLSLAWDRTAKTIAGWGWVRTPRVTDAALMAAFAGARHNQTDQRALNAAHDACVQAGAECPAPKPQEAHMSLWDQFKAALEGTPAATFDDGDPTPVPPAPAAPTAEFTALQTKLAAMESAAATARAADAATFAATLVAEHRILPADRPLWATAYAEFAAQDAATTPTVTFADAAGQAQIVSRTALLRQLAASLPAHALTTEVGPAAFTALPGQVDATITSEAAQAARIQYLQSLAGVPAGED